jgi:hypothetical protein
MWWRTGDDHALEWRLVGLGFHGRRTEASVTGDEIDDDLQRHHFVR